jgi:NitT/TauT family transport system ATP-binding protein
MALRAQTAHRSVQQGVARVTDAVPPTTTADPTLAGGVLVDHLSKSFGIGADRIVVLDDITLSIARGEFVSIIGPSGCGKSTILRIVAGLVSADSGTVSIDGETVDRATADKLVGLVPQSPALLPWRSVLANVRLPIQVNAKANRGRQLRDPEAVLRSFGLGHVLRRYPFQLSGGMQQRVAIARAFVFDPAILLMDEPFSALDELTREQQRLELLEFWQSNRKAVLFVTHSVAEAVALSDRIIVMSARPGRIETVIEVNLPRPRTEAVYADAQFHALTTEVRSVLRRVTERHDA